MNSIRKIIFIQDFIGTHYCRPPPLPWSMTRWRGRWGESEDQLPLNAQQGFQLQSLAPRQRDACTTAPCGSPLPTLSHQPIFALRVGVVASRHNPYLRFLWGLITTKILICVVVPWSGLFCQGPYLKWILLWKGILGSQLLHTLLRWGLVMQCSEFQDIINTLRHTKIVQIARLYNRPSGSILVKKLFMVLIVMTVIELH